MAWPAVRDSLAALARVLQISPSLQVGLGHIALRLDLQVPGPGPRATELESSTDVSNQCKLNYHVTATVTDTSYQYSSKLDCWSDSVLWWSHGRRVQASSTSSPGQLLSQHGRLCLRCWVIRLSLTVMHWQRPLLLSLFLESKIGIIQTDWIIPSDYCNRSAAVSLS